ncbi:hypothetical protein FRB99_005462 [Tulasnella sp. 403]|nr:hypothetical protein FRB99_005462 [Tulasnella sp. 403]
MRILYAAGLLTLPLGLRAFSDTTPLLVWSSSPSPALDGVPSSDGLTIQSEVLLTTTLKDDVCNYGAVVIVEHPGLHASDLRKLPVTSSIAERLHSSPSKLHIPYPKAANPVGLARTISELCGSTLVDLGLEEDVSKVLAASGNVVVNIDLPELDTLGSSRKAEMAQLDAKLAKPLDTISNKFPSHLVVIAGTTPSSFCHTKRQLAGQRALPSEFAPLPTPIEVEKPKLPKGGIFHRYQLLTPGLISSLGVTFLLIVPLMLLVINALASIKSPVRSDNVRQAQEKKNHAVRAQPMGNSLNSDKAPKPKNATGAVFSAFPSRRSVVYGTKGMVACSQPLAAEAGLEILRKGGNAADAAVAVSAALNGETVKGLNGSGRAPQALTIDYLRKQGLKGSSIPLTNLNSVTVPGAAAAWIDAVALFGSKNVTFAEVMDPAIRLAEQGVPTTEINSQNWQRSEDLLRNASPDGHTMLLNGKAPLPGQIKRFPELAQTFKELISKGKDGFYKGRVAEAIVELIRNKGGVMSLDDLAKHQSTPVEPISYTHSNDVTIYECPPNGQGITALMALGILDVLQEEGEIRSLSSMEHNSVEYLHVLIESLRIAFSDTRYYVADPDVEHIPVKELLSKEYLSSRAKLFDPSKANPEICHGYPAQSSDTVYFCVTDQWGNGCSFIQSNYAGFGTGGRLNFWLVWMLILTGQAIPHGCGFTLQNRGTGFSLEPDHPNALKPGKRPYHTIIPAIATRGDELFLTYGVMGGFMQPQGHVQVLLNILRGFTVQAALDAPRFCISAALSDSEVLKREAMRAGDINSEVYLEEGIDDDVVETLKSMGHDAKVVKGYRRAMLGRGQIIQKVTDESGEFVWAAGSDPRADGHAAPQI